MQKGVFITLEGIDRAGKSTQAALLADFLSRRGLAVLQTREPGGTRLAEQLRDLLLAGGGLDALTETLLMFAARREHVAKKIAPALAAGQWVICDRFTDSTLAYQGGGRGVRPDLIERLADDICADCAPHLTILINSPPPAAARRLLQPNDAPDAFEREDDDFYRRVAAAYNQLAQRHPRRIGVVQRNHKTAAGYGAQRDRASVHADIAALVMARCPLPASAASAASAAPACTAAQ